MWTWTIILIVCTLLICIAVWDLQTIPKEPIWKLNKRKRKNKDSLCYSLFFLIRY